MQCAGHAHDSAADREGLDAQQQYRLAERCRNGRVVPDRAQHAAERRAHQSFQQHEYDRHQRERKAQQHDIVSGRRNQADEWPRNIRDTDRSAGEPRFVEKKNADDLAEPDRHDRQIVFLKPDRQEGEHGADDRAQNSGNDHRAEPSKCRRQQRGEIYQAGHAQLQVEREANEGRDGDQYEERGEVGDHLRTALPPNRPWVRTSNSPRITAKLTTCR